jgi:hypothetical protein
VVDQNAKLLEGVECSARTISIGLKDSGNDPFARQPGDGAMAMFVPHVEPSEIAGFAGIAQADIFGAFHVGRNERRDGASRGVFTFSVA